MKKAVVILIAIIFVVSIALVNFYGVKFQTYHEVIYAQSIELTNEGLQDVLEEGQTIKGIILKKDANGERNFQIKYKLNPDNVSKPGVTFNYDKQKTFVNITDDGLVTFSKAGSITVTIKSTDGSNCQAKLKITFIN